jgi:hypothetical protein
VTVLSVSSCGRLGFRFQDLKELIVPLTQLLLGDQLQFLSQFSAIPMILVLFPKLLQWVCSRYTSFTTYSTLRHMNYYRSRD